MPETHLEYARSDGEILSGSQASASSFGVSTDVPDFGSDNLRKRSSVTFWSKPKGLFPGRKNESGPKSLTSQKVVYILGAFAFCMAIFASLHTVFTNKQTKQQVEETLGVSAVIGVDDQGVSEGTAEDPAEVEVSAAAYSAYSVVPEQPRYIKIPIIGVDARVKSSGVNAKGRVDAPWNVHDVSWFNEGVLPGSSAGSSLLVGHVSSWTTDGVFKHIDRLTPGALIQIERGDGSVINYAVKKTENIPLDEVDMSKILGTEIAGKHDIKLMTCSGNYDRDSERYDHRFVVYAAEI